MIYGISGRLISKTARYAGDLNSAGILRNWPPAWIAAHAWIESIVLEANGTIPDAATCHSTNGDGGLGGCQITAEPEGYVGPWPFTGWDNMQTNAEFAIDYYLRPAAVYWNGRYGYSGPTLARVVAAEYNAGRSAAERAHAAGNVDSCTEGGDYAARVLAALQMLLTTGDYPK